MKQISDIYNICSPPRTPKQSIPCQGLLVKAVANTAMVDIKPPIICHFLSKSQRFTITAGNPENNMT